MPVAGFAKAFRQTEMAKGYLGELAQPYVAPNGKCDALMTTKTYALTGRFVNLVCCTFSISIKSIINQIILCPETLGLQSDHYVTMAHV